MRVWVWRSGVLASCLGAGILLGCASQPVAQTTHPLAAVKARPPVVIVPGITGSQLSSTGDGEMLWGEGRQVLRPRDGGYALARPLSLPLEGSDSQVEATGVIEEMRLFAGLVRKPIYGPVPEILSRHGYRRGDLTQPDAQADLFLFAYDWRGDNVTSAHRLGERLQALAATRQGDDALAVDLVCQSNGAYICRYVVKYGLASLEEAEQGIRRPLAGVVIRKLILVGTSNGGSVRILREVDRGRTYVAGLGRSMTPEVIFTFPSIYQDLPFHLPAPFIDGEGKALDWDLYDAQLWVDQGWSIFDPEVAGRAARRPDLFGDHSARIEFLRRCLHRAQRLQAVLRADVEPQTPLPTRYYMLQNGYYVTSQRAVVQRQGSRSGLQGSRSGLQGSRSELQGGSELLFNGDKDVDNRPYLAALAGAPGDGHATLTSQMFLSPQELAALRAEPFLLPGKHFELIIDAATLRRMMDFLHE